MAKKKSKTIQYLKLIGVILVALSIVLTPLVTVVFILIGDGNGHSF